MKTTLISITIVSLCLAFMFCEKYFTERQNNKRLNNNFEILAAEFSEIKKQVVTTGVLEMKVKEIKASFPNLEKQLKDEFNTKLKNAIQYSESKTIVNHTFETTVKDSFKLDTIPIKLFAYRDNWIDFSAFSTDSVFTVEKNIIPVPLKQLINREPWKLKFLPPWNWGKRKLMQTIKTDNPYAVIDYARTINIKK